jgi:hypothetical protein
VVESSLRRLEVERNTLLLQEENKWILRSRATWLASGNANTKIFHNFASHNRVKKFIWDIKGADGDPVNEDSLLKKEVVTYYKNFYKESICHNTAEQYTLIEHFPQMIDEENSRVLFKTVTMEEMKAVLFHFKKEKSLGPDGWTAKFFTFFLDLVREDLLAMVKDSRLLGPITGGLNSTFLTMIPKANKPTSFEDFHPISLCNLCYKIISKIIANQIKPFLSAAISHEHMGFLKGRHMGFLFSQTYSGRNRYSPRDFTQHKKKTS